MDTGAIYITKKTTNFLELSVQGSVQCFELLNEDNQLVKCHSRFWSSLVRWL